MKKGTHMSFTIGVIAIAVLHFVASFFVAFAAGISTSRPLKIASNILTFPLPLIPKGFELPGVLNWLPWVLLSLGWGFIICYGLRLLGSGLK